MMRWVKTDAQNRAWRAALQGIVVVFVLPAMDAALQVLVTALRSGDPDLNWGQLGITAGIAALTAAMMSLAAYVHRAYVDPSAIPSALPPRPPGVSAAEAPFTEPTRSAPPTSTHTG